MNERFTVQIAEAMRENKLADETLRKSETRYHPELPQKQENLAYIAFCASLFATFVFFFRPPWMIQEFMQYLCLIEDSKEEESCEEVDRLLQALDCNDSDSSSSSTNDGSDKKKKSKAKKARNT